MSVTVNELFSVAGKVAVVTGGSAGIGRMIASGLVAAGVKTYIVARNAESANKAAQEMSEQGYCRAIIADCSSLDGIESVAEQLQQQESQLDILVNNAGILFEEPIDDFSEESWDMSFDLNTKSVFFLTQKLLPLLRAGANAEDPSRIINIGSADGSSLSDREHYAYLASKASVHHLTKGLAKRLASEHITVNAIAPGPFPSAMTGGFPEEIVNAVISLIPRGRFGTEQDIIGTVVYLASRAGAYTTASVIPLDGGWTGTK
jgi:NAD(P)-dependent dehydrogenase (short-subunit alcohol dehydrogenase family)